MFLKRFLFVFLVFSLYSCGSGSENTAPPMDNAIVNGIDNNCLSRNMARYPLPADSSYILPYGIGESFSLGQGNCTTFTHSETELSEFAFDFLMDIGTPVHAAREGIVLAVQEESFDNDDTAPENLIVIEHADGTLAFYVHLTNNGAFVDLGQEVVQGEFIGFSGNTGFSTAPHLHFEVVEPNDQCFQIMDNGSGTIDNCPSIPVSFSNAQPNDRILMQGTVYTALQP